VWGWWWWYSGDNDDYKGNSGISPRGRYKKGGRKRIRGRKNIKDV
jgi:hypothetical protein